MANDDLTPKKLAQKNRNIKVQLIEHDFGQRLEGFKWFKTEEEANAYIKDVHNRNTDPQAYWTAHISERRI